MFLPSDVTALELNVLGALLHVILSQVLYDY